MGVYQKDLTAWFNNYFYFRGFFIRLQSSLYYLANFKRFFILSSPRHLFSYTNKFVSTPSHYSPFIMIDGYKKISGENNKNAETTIKRLKYVQDELNKRDKKFLCIEGALALELYEDMISSNSSDGDINSRYYRYFEDYYKSDADKAMNTYKALLNKYGIHFFDSQTFLEKNLRLTGIEPVSFYDGHWNRYGAGLVVIESLKYLKSIYKTDWELPQIKSVEISTTPIAMETECLRRVQMFISVQNGFMQEKLSFPYIVYEAPKEKNGVKVAVLGDSFTSTYEIQLKDSKFTDAKNIKKYHNRDSDIKTDIAKIISQNDIIIVIFVESTFYGYRLKYVVDVFYDYLKANEK